MSKKLIHDYTFLPSSNTVIIDGIHRQERFLLITNVTDNQQIFVFNSLALGIQSYTISTSAETTTLVLNYDCSSMSSSDKLQIFIESDSQNFEPSDTYVDPVSKFRVSQPENLIDTDFEYGLQSSKWETLELVKNIPTFFSRNGDESLLITSMSVVLNSSIVTVVSSIEHKLIRGNPIIVVGTRLASCNGAFVVTTVINSTTFQYRAKSNSSSTGTINDTYTQLFVANVYQGTEFKLSNIDAIVTDGLPTSSLEVTTEYPTGFIEGTSFFLSNSLGQRILPFDASLVDPDNFNAINVTVTNNTATGEVNSFALGSIQPYKYAPSKGKFFSNSEITVDLAQETITFATAHGLEDNAPYIYIVGWGNTVIGGLADFARYFVRVLNSTTIYLTTTKSSTTRVNLTSAGASFGIVRSCLARVYRPISINLTNGIDTITFDEAIPDIITDGTQALMPVTTTLANLAVATGSATANFYDGIVYFPKVVSQGSTTLSFTSVVRGGLIDLNNGTINGSLMPVQLLSDARSMWFEAHGLTTNDLIQFQVVSGTVPGGLTTNAFYVVEKINDNRIAFRSEAATTNVIFSSLGSNNGVYRIVGNVLELNNDSFYLPNHNLSDGDLVTYSNEGNTDISGLTNSSSYYIFRSTVDRFKLSTDKTGYLGTAKTVVQNTTNFNTGTEAIALADHGFTSGDAVIYTSDTPVGGLKNGGIYWAYVINTGSFNLHFTKAGSLINNAATRVNIGQIVTGTGSFRKTALVDLTSAGSNTHKFTSAQAGASDNVYTITEVVDDNTFKMSTNFEIPEREIVLVHANTIWLEQNAFRVPDHYFVTGAPVLYETTGSAPGGLTNNTTYYIIRVSQNWIKLAASAADAITNTAITLTNIGSGTSTLSTSSVVGEVPGPGTISIAANSVDVVGTDTQFPSIFSHGDILKLYQPEITNIITVSSINTSTDVFTATAHGMSIGNIVKMTASVAPAGTNNDQFYYVYVIDANTFTLHNNSADATGNLNKVDVTSTGTTVTLLRITSLGSTTEKEIAYVNSATGMELTTSVGEAFTSVAYAVGSTLLIRADGFALHRPYDGGVELIPSTNPDSQMVRQTRKYFRYQSGKGIQVSFAVNFSPTTQIDLMTRFGTTATITTRNPHRVTQGLSITIIGATSSVGENFWNLSTTVTNVEDDYRFNVTLNGIPALSTAEGLPEYYVNNWTNSELRCGLFDDQNGLFFEYDGQNIKCCRRSSVLQISGTVSVNFKSAEILGNGTRFLSQLNTGDNLVIKGQTYKITKIVSNTLLYILPSYRGRSTSNVIVTKTVDTKVPQSQWNIDACDGTGPTGFYLDIHKIQMAYMDYSWYGAGKVRFGFKDQKGTVRYVHEFIHNNKFTEAYMRSGNLPARYDIENRGAPSYVPALAHWGTSVIMDGRFDDDKAYVFTASSQSISITGSSSLTISARVETLEFYYFFINGQWRTLGRAILLAAANPAYNTIVRNTAISGAGLSVGTLTSIPQQNGLNPQPYQASVDVSYFGGTGNLNTNRAARNLLIIDRNATATAGAASNYTVNLSSVTTPVVYEQALISIRLSPSVDTGTPGFLGEREIINRMQLILNSVGILSTHSAEIILKLNGSLNNNDWQRVNPPSLSQLIYHDTSDTIIGGTIVYSFRAQGGTGTTGRSPVITTADLGEIATLGNSIMGGDGTFPDGPDVLTVVARLVEDPSTVSSTNPFNITGRISWSESQA